MNMGMGVRRLGLGMSRNTFRAHHRIDLGSKHDLLAMLVIMAVAFMASTGGGHFLQPVAAALSVL